MYEKDYELFLYEGVGHSFLNPNQDASPRRAEAAAQSLERTFAFFLERLQAGRADAEDEAPAE